MVSEKDESRGVEHLPQSELEATPGLSKPQTSIDIDQANSAAKTNATSKADDAKEPDLHFSKQTDESRGIEHLPQSELEASPGLDLPS